MIARDDPLTTGRPAGLPVPVLAVPLAAAVALGVTGVVLGRGGVPSVAPVALVGVAFAVAFTPFGSSCCAACPATRSGG